MKKIILPLCLIIAFLLFMVAFMFISSKMPRKEEKTDFYWIPEKSHFVDYKIKNDKMVFSYSICFVNDSDEDISVGVSASFRKSEINDWIQYENFFMGYDEKGVMKYELIKAKQKKNVIFYFEGKYISDNINTNLSFPEELILVTR